MEELYLKYKIKDRNTGKLKECFIKIPDVGKFCEDCEEINSPHDFKVYERSIVKKEDYEKWKQNINFLKKA
ncbi:MAG: hypothetical protein SCALA702_13200 [Melioribacteraceae bacterium]|nr:MAG: hypothetical protein SCALA702_13200 [Melioribacteraceae bacterium]